MYHIDSSNFSINTKNTNRSKKAIKESLKCISTPLSHGRDEPLNRPKYQFFYIGTNLVF